MQSLVFLEPDNIKAIPFTTSDLIAERTENNYRSVQRTIENQMKRLETFGVMRFEITLPAKGSKGGRPKKIYQLNEPQATLIITFLKNTDIVADFKTELVRQFYLMRAELQKRQMLRQQLKPIRRELTDIIQENPDKGEWSYKLYTDLAYKFVTGKISAQLRKERNAPKKSKAIDYMTSEEIEKIAKLENQIGVLKEMGMDYYQIKSLLLNRQMVGNVGVA